MDKRSALRAACAALVALALVTTGCSGNQRKADHERRTEAETEPERG